MVAHRLTSAVVALAQALSAAALSAQQPCGRRSWTDPSPHHSRLVALEGVRLHYLDWGGNGPVLLFLHGLGDNAHTFDDLAPRFTPTFRALALTRRGSGESEHPHGGYGIHTLTEDIRQFLDSMRVARVTLVGHSLAGLELLRFAAQHPDRVDGLIFLEALVDFPFYSREVSRVRARLPGLAPPLEVRRSWTQLRSWWQTEAPELWSPAREASLWYNTEEDSSCVLREVQRDTTVDSLLELLTWEPPYERVRAPALVLYADQESLTVDKVRGRLDADGLDRVRTLFREVIAPATFRALARLRAGQPDVRLVTFPYTRHELHWQHRDRVYDEMLVFLTPR